MVFPSDFVSSFSHYAFVVNLKVLLIISTKVGKWMLKVLINF